jgi:hypothetical protein
MNALEKKIDSQDSATLKETLVMLDSKIEAERLAAEVVLLSGGEYDYSNLQAMNKVRFTLLTVLEIRDPEFTRSYFDARYAGLEA